MILGGVLSRPTTMDIRYEAYKAGEPEEEPEEVMEDFIREEKEAVGKLIGRLERIRI